LRPATPRLSSFLLIRPHFVELAASFGLRLGGRNGHLRLQRRARR
jgi:hypothetical protein